MKARVFSASLIAAVAINVFADSWTDPETGYMWTYRIVGDGAEIYGTYDRRWTPCIYPKPTGIVTIPSTLGGKPVTNIGPCAFYGCSGLASVTIPDSVTNIGDSAFIGGCGIEHITIPGNVTNIEDSAFFDCSNLANVAMTIASVKSIGRYAFGGCISLIDITIPKSVTNVGDYAFSGCSNLMHVVMSDNIISLGHGAFRNCSKLAKVDMEDSSSLTDIGYNVFEGCMSLIEDDYVIVGGVLYSYCGAGGIVRLPHGITTIAPRFEGREKISQVTIPDTVLRIMPGAFAACIDLTSVTIPSGVKSIGNGAFDTCWNLRRVILPNSVTNIGDCAFTHCTNLVSVTIGDGVTDINFQTFRWCESLKQVSIGSGVTNISVDAFMECPSLCEISVSTGNNVYQSVSGLLLSKDGRVLYRVPEGCKNISIPNGVEQIASMAFYRCNQILNIEIPESVTSIGYGAFYWCEKLANVAMYDGVTNIGNRAFYNCDAMKDIILPNSLTQIGEYAFEECDGLTRIVIPKNVVDIGAYAFIRCRNLEEVYLLDNLTIESSSYPPKTRIIRYVSDQIVYFDANGGLVTPQSKSVVFGYPYGTLPKPVYAGYSFSGWLQGGEVVDDFTKVSAVRDHVLIARWIPNKYLITFDAGNKDDCVIIEQDCGAEIVSPSVARTGYSFSEWEPELPECVPPSNMTFTAQWTPNHYIVQFNANGGDGEIDPVGAVYDVEFPLPSNTFYRAGYTFAGWSEIATGDLVFNDGTVVSNLISDLNGKTTLYALWAINQYEVAFDGNGGDFGVSALPSVTNTQDYGSMIVAPTATREGYTFAGWEPEVDATVPASNVTYTAQWLINQYEVAFDADGGALGESALPSVTNTQDYGSAIVAPTATREGYAFAGWEPEVDMTVPASNVTYTAQWWVNQYEVVFDANGGVLGESALPRVTNTQDYESAIVAPEIAREGYTFAGWQPSVLETVPASNVTYTAQWRVNQYEVAFDGNGGALGERALPRVVTSQDYGSAIVPPSASRAGCTFEGWTPDVDATVPARDVSYTAQWKVWDVTIESADVKIKDLYPDDYGRITNILIGAEIEILPSGFFDGCDSLESITFLSPETDIGDNDLRKVGRLFDVQPDGYWIVQGVLLGHKGECPGAIPDVDSISRVIDDALEGCIALTDLTFTAESALTSIGTNAFKGCTELQSLVLPSSLEDIGDEAFMGCSYLDNVIVPGSVKRVGARAFKNCTGFTGALIEYGVESLGDEAFYGDWRISEVDIPSSVTNIGVSAFGGDSSIIRVGLRGDVRKVSEIFSNYSILREATVKGGDGAIVDGLFEGCAELADVHFLGNSPELANDGRSIYSGTPETLTTYVATTSTGWDGTKGSHSLPQAWPLVGNRRSIAQWDLPTYLVLFDSNGGTLGVQSTYQYSERKFTLPPEPVQTGYKFAGWWTKPVGGLRVTDDTVFIEGVYRTLYAHWTKGRWVFLDPNGGTVENEFVTYIEQTEYGVLPTPVRTGYAFDGWTYNGKTVLATDELLTDEDHVLKADWRKNKYTVTFDANFGDGGGVYELEYDSAIVPPVVVREGYMFLGWSPEVAATVPASNVTYAAQWKLNEYRVSLFVGNGEEGSQLVVTHGAKVGDIAMPVREGYVFGGWYDKPEDGKLVDGDTLIVGDMSLYAKWNSIYTVVFDANGGEGVMPDQPFVYGEEQSLSNIVFKATDRRFAGWATEKDGIVEYDDGEVVSNLTETANGVVTLYAVWEVWTDAMQTLDDIFGGDGDVSLDDHGTIVVTLTNVVSGTVEIPDNVGAVTIDLNGHDMAGDDGPAIRIVKGDGEGDATRLVIVDTSEGEKGQISGGGESAGIEVAEDAATGVKLDVEEGVGVFNGDGSEQELKPKLVGTGKVTTPKTWKVGQKVTWKATADKGSVFARWEGPLVDSLNLTRNVRRNPSLAFAVPEGFETNMVTAVFIPIDDDGLYSLGITQTEFVLKDAVSDVWVTDDSQSYVTATASGLPTGLKFDAKKMTITGTPTKGGVYWVQVKAKNASGYQWAENVMVTVSGDGKEAKVPKLTRTAYHPLTVICANDGGTVSGTGVYAEGKKVSVKATPAKGYVFAGWHETANSEKGTVNGVDGADYRSASLKVTVPETRYVFALFATKEDDADSLKVAVEDVTTEKDGTIALNLGACVESLSLPKLAVSGLPTGLKYDAKTLKVVGKATKPGVYTVTVKATNAAVTKATDASTATFKITVPNFECAALPGLKPETDAYGIVRPGVMFDAGLIDCTPEDGWAVKAAGLPAGLKFAVKETKDAAYGVVPALTVYGVPTAKAGSYTVTFTASKKGEANQVATITLNVESLPSWAVGTFDGVNLEGDMPCGIVSMTVAASGKISGKLIDGAGTWTLSAASFDGVRLAGDGSPNQDPKNGSPMSDVGSPVFHATVTGKNGKMAVTNEVEVSAETVRLAGDGSPYRRGVVSGRAVSGTPVEWAAWQNLWKTEPWKSDAKAFAKAKPVEFVASVPSVSPVPFTSGVVALKFAASGAVTASGKFTTGVDERTGRDIVYTANCASVLIPDAGWPEPASCRVYLCFPQKDGKFGGWSVDIPLVWDGAEFSLGGEDGRE